MIIRKNESIELKQTKTFNSNHLLETILIIILFTGRLLCKRMNLKKNMKLILLIK